jgi:hypothetical protein
MATVALQSLDLALGKVQDTLGTASTGVLSVTSDFLPFDRGFTCTFKQAMQGRDVVNSRFGSQASVPGDAYYEVKGKMPLLVDNNVEDQKESALGRLLQCSGFESTGVNTFALSQNTASMKDITVWSYIGAIGVSDGKRKGLLSKAHSVMFSPKMTFDNGKYAVVDFDGKGAVLSSPIIADYPSATATISSTTIPTVMSATVNLLGKGYLVSKMSVDFGVETTLVKAMSGSFGYDRATISNIKTATFKATIIAQDLTDSNPFSLLSASATGVFSLAFGGVILDSGTSGCQITDVSVGNDGGIKTMELSGLFINNDVTLTL